MLDRYYTTACVASQVKFWNFLIIFSLTTKGTKDTKENYKKLLVAWGLSGNGKSQEKTKYDEKKQKMVKKGKSKLWPICGGGRKKVEIPIGGTAGV